jgi:hypothetical protein
MTELVPLLRHEDVEIVRVGLKVVQDRKEDAADVAADVVKLLKHDAADVRGQAVAALQALGPAGGKAVPNLSQVLLDRLVVERNRAVRKALAGLLGERLAALKPDQMIELVPLLGHRDPEIVRLGLKAVQGHKEDAADVAAEVARLLEHDDAEVRGAAVAALEAMGPAAQKALPRLFPLLLERLAAEKDPAVRESLSRLFEARLATLKPEQMTKLLPLLQHRDPEIVRLGLKVVRDRKEDAADVAGEVAKLLEHDDAGVRGAALAALQSLGLAARKALPKVFEILDQTPRRERTSLALATAGLIDFKDRENVKRLVPFLVDGLHPEALQAQGEDTEAAINRVLLKIGQPAVEGIFAALDPNSRGKDNINFRKNLYNALTGLGPSCRSRAHCEKLRMLRNKEVEKKYRDVIEAAQTAYAAMTP